MARGKKTEKILTHEEKLQQALVPENEQPYKVPENWCWTYVSSGFDVTSSKRVHKEDWLSEGIPFYRTRELVKLSDYGYVDNELFISQELYDECKKNYGVPKVGDLLVSGVGTIGVPFIISDEKPLYFKDGNVIWFQNKGIFLPKYIFYLYKSTFMYSQIHDMSAGTTVDTYTIINATKTLLPLPPLPEQQRIVNRIESLFAKLDEAKEKAQAVVDGFEDRKAAILHKAFSGELTKQWRHSKGIPKDSWRECDLISILIDKPRNGYSPKPVDYETPYKSMTLSATTSGVFLPEYYKYIDEEIPDDSYLWLKPGDILMQRANSLEKVGTSALYTGREHEFIYPDLMMKLQVNESAIPEYISYYLKTDKVMQYLRANATGTSGNMPKINQKVVSKIPVVLPKIDEQIEIVRELDMLFKLVQDAKDAAESVISQINIMQRSILARAFRGELGTNDPTEESAVELLKRIL